ncbi:hypothetical protein [Clostridium folliculivorans]|uniref:Uncharacterized protein n=1 Tax=Clostridium folliculivorans TaxID=2886038 RepID=A0A9W5XZB2_9CLOT|nr:hypothetical protein [Clostridium folliculivorans]GKU23659.1 hypothetical protein CFOLD11_04850 [Clostridium folliculivorans]GKU29775.1 hypothetical protein CFB3_18820 [Clostridium folliculivorans]
MKKRTKIYALLLSLSLTIGVFTPSIAHAKTLDAPKTSQSINSNYFNSKSLITYQEEKLIREQFAKDGLDNTSIERCITKLKNGQVLDAETPEKLAKVPKEFFAFTKPTSKQALLASKTKMYKFPDGSYIKLTSKPIAKKTLPIANKNLITPNYVYTSNYSTEYVDEFIEGNYGTSHAGFVTSFTEYRGGGSTIYNAHDTTGWGYGTWTYNQPTIVRAVQTGTQPALAYASMTQVSSAGGLYTKTSGYTLELNVFETKYYMFMTKR